MKRVPLSYGAPWTGDHRKHKPTERVGFCYRCGKGPRVLKPHPTNGEPKPKFCNGCHEVLSKGDPSPRKLAREKDEEQNGPRPRVYLPSRRD